MKTPAPSGPGRLAVLGPVFAVVLLGVAVVLGREASVSWGWVSGESWIISAATFLDDQSVTPAVAVGGFVAVLLGFWLVVTGVRPRTRRTLRVAGSPDVHLGLRDLARLSSGAARSCDGVLSASSTASRRRVRVKVKATSGEVRDEVARAVSSQLIGLETPPRITVAVEAPREVTP